MELDSSQLDNSFSKGSKAVNEYNADVRQSDFQSSVVGSKVDLLNNIRKYPAMDDFNKNKAQMSDDWDKNFGSRLKPFGEDFARQKDDIFKNVKEQYGIDLRVEGYARIGTSNPYTGEAYYKYYGPDGNVLWAQWNDDATGLKKYQQDFDTKRRRQRDQKAALTAEMGELQKYNDQFKSSLSSGQRALKSLNNGVLRVNFVGKWSGSDNVGNWLRLTLYADGTTRYTWGRATTSYDGAGTWQQTGSRMTMRTTVSGVTKVRSRSSSNCNSQKHIDLEVDIPTI